MEGTTPPPKRQEQEMTRKDYELIADTIGGMTYLSETDRATIAHDFADQLKNTNPLFNRDRFLTACGVK